RGESSSYSAGEGATAPPGESMRSTTPTVASCFRKRSSVSTVSPASSITPRSSTTPSDFRSARRLRRSPSPNSPRPLARSTAPRSTPARIANLRRMGCRRAMATRPPQRHCPALLALALLRLGHEVAEREPDATLALHVGVHLLALLALAERLDGEADALLARVHVGDLRLDHVTQLEQGGRLVDPLGGEL